jgi:Ca2+-binding RTX toxin-like protein
MKRLTSDDTKEEGRGLILADRSGKEAAPQSSLEGMNSEKVMSRRQIVKLTGLLGVALTVAALTVTVLTVAAPTVAHASHVPDCAGFHPTNTPTAGNDVIVGTAGNDVLAGGAGDDQISGLDGHDVICGNEGNDSVHGANGSDAVLGGDGDDTATGGNDNDDVFGENGNDKLYASTVFTGPIPVWPQTCEQSGELIGVYGPTESGGNQITEFGLGNSLSGGDGYDLLVGAQRSDIMVGWLRGDDLYGLGGTDRLTGSRASDCLSGGPNSDNLYDGDPTNLEPDDIDVFWGGGSADTLNAFDGDSYDSLDGGSSIADKCTADSGDKQISC